MLGTLFDTHIWVAIVFKNHPFHRAAQQKLEHATPANPAVFCRSTEQSFLRLITSDRLLKFYQVESLTNRAATLLLYKLQAMPQVHVQDEPPGTTALWHCIAALNTPSPRFWMDAYLAAFAISSGLHLLTTDKDFKNFIAHGLNLTLIQA